MKDLEYLDKIMNENIIANIYRVGLLLGYYSTESISQWAELEVVKGNPNTNLIELLFEGNQHPQK
ncbi:hypothetical protein [Paraflavitalea speifideaquila]|uniref:hypothetical protein n=1 Tax=Paraflavitalea speifideaquila TaxID=3076558 RepID=UPI0028EE6BC1|nr:hypothetical protein [Paraflavitalea speifideiaquila]